MRQLVHTMFISNNRPSFHLLWKDNLVKHWKVSKYYATYCSCKGQRKPIYFGGLFRFVLLIFSMFLFLLVSWKSTINFNIVIQMGLMRFIHPWDWISVYRKYWFKGYRPKPQGELISWGELIMYYRPKTIKLNPWWKRRSAKVLD